MRPVQVTAIGSGRVVTAKRLFSANVSLGGMFIQSPTPFPRGQRVRVCFEVKGRALPFADGEVTYALTLPEAREKGRTPGFGVRFTKLPTRSRALVEYLLMAAAAKRPNLSAGEVTAPGGENFLRRRWLAATIAGAALALACSGALWGWRLLQPPPEAPAAMAGPGH